MSSDIAYINTLREFLSHDGVVGGKKRWWAGKKEFDFQNNEIDSTTKAKMEVIIEVNSFDISHNKLGFTK
jgi:hypothetical protein